MCNDKCTCKTKRKILVEQDETGQSFLICSKCGKDLKEMTAYDFKKIKFDPSYAIRVAG